VDYIKWRESIENSKIDYSIDSEDYSKQLGEKCCFQLEQLVNTLDLADSQIEKIVEVLFFEL
jgi:hypothetical protein